MLERRTVVEFRLLWRQLYGVVWRLDVVCVVIRPLVAGSLEIVLGAGGLVEQTTCEIVVERRRETQELYVRRISEIVDLEDGNAHLWLPSPTSFPAAS